MNRHFWRSRVLFHLVAVLLGTAASLCVFSIVSLADDDLSTWRTERRASIRDAFTDGDKSTASFRLMVIPVDFEGTRLPDVWDPARDLAPRVAGHDGETLERYFSTASGVDGWLQIVLSPLVHLDGESADYSDISITGFTRTRALAGQAIAGADAAGVPFATADANADGRVDGVLILHAAPGLENDPVNGHVVPLQYYLASPYRQFGVEAQHYAVASLHSGPGIWAHETAHLLGLEDRYDLFLSPEEDSAVSRGGLGIFSLMSAGAWGRGDGTGAALLDAYSAVQLGWAEAVEIHRGSLGAVTMNSGAVLKLPISGESDAEYFLLQARGGFDDAPYDAVFPELGLLVYHVDETVPDGTYGDGHLRVRLVEADNVDDLAEGDSPGTLDDMFPDETGYTEWHATTSPSSASYHGPSGIICRFHAEEDELRVEYTLLGNPFDTVMRFVDSAGDTLCDITVREPGLNASTVSVDIFAFTFGGAWGHFESGSPHVQRDLESVGSGVWVLTDPIIWRPNGIPPPGATTVFTIQLYRDGQPVGHADRTWLWQDTEHPLALSNPWSDGWMELTSLGNTLWQAWPANAADDLPDIPLLACTGSEFTDSTDWPDVTYWNNSDARILSPLFFTGGGSLRMIHALDAHAYEATIGTDGAQVLAQFEDGQFHSLQPLGGYDGRVDSSVSNEIHGQDAFIGPGEFVVDHTPLWTVDVFPLQDVAPDWTRLQLRLSSDPLWRGRGWLIARMDLWPQEQGDVPFQPVWDVEQGGVALSWPWEPPEWITLEASLDHGDAWTTIWEGGVPTGQTRDRMIIPTAQLALPDSVAVNRTLLRARIRIDLGEVVSRTGLMGDPDPSPEFSLGFPRPNPATDETVVMVQTSLLAAHLAIYDMRGRLVRNWWLPNGAYVITWDGRDDDGRTAAAGVYVLRLRAHDGSRTLTRKVTLLR